VSHESLLAEALADSSCDWSEVLVDGVGHSGLSML
jgi:hypothetical protein